MTSGILIKEVKNSHHVDLIPLIFSYLLGITLKTTETKL